MLLKMVKKKYIIKLKEQSRVIVLFSYDILGGFVKIDLVDNNYIIYIKKEYIDIDFNDKQQLEIYFQKLFKKLRDIYYIEIKGYYNITVYIDSFYGAVLEIKKEEFEYYDYLDNQVDMRISIINTKFLYAVNDIILKDKVNVYKSKDHLYLAIKTCLSKRDMNYLTEFSKVVYNTENIKNNLVMVN